MTNASKMLAHAAQGSQHLSSELLLSLLQAGVGGSVSLALLDPKYAFNKPSENFSPEWRI
jgi:hypothetical protein